MPEKKSDLLILYSTVDGHAKHICEYAQKKLADKKEIVIASMDDCGEYNVADFDEILVGASVRYGYHRKNVYQFVTSNKEELDKKKTAFFFIKFDSPEAGKKHP